MPSYFISGANRGIGFALTSILLEDPENIVVAGIRNLSGAQALDDLGTKHSGRLSIVPFDLADPAKIEKAAELTSALLPTGLDCIINNAGVNFEPATPMATIDFDLIEETYRLNTIAPARAVRAFLPLIRKGHEKKVVFTTSVLGSVGSAGEFTELSNGYSMSKAALNIMARKWAPSLKAEGITTIVVHPGYVDTPLGDIVEEYISTHFPGMKMISPEESARGCLKVIHATKLGDDMTIRSYEGEQVPW
ncbi:hypothetical protein B0H21DRAFT_727543 [Amylocystis lapponica]|nr:hypothetical protein B0H21DRAFT_727543 [Amylocystis lapponica]